MFTVKNILSIALAAIFSLSMAGDLFSQTPIQADTTDELFDSYEKSLLFGFSSDTRGVIESTLFNMINYKIAYPEFESEKALLRAKEIAENGDHHTLQYKAYLTLRYYTDRELFPRPEALMAELDHRDQDKIFRFLQNGIHSGNFTTTDR